ncbi:hypothetical protein FRB94_007977 [Tulasnella sp. JGI-2019a]|nr:hypothetical protein FRB94_007977 [Tulasnella sp. JGI-2019a]
MSQEPQIPPRILCCVRHRGTMRGMKHVSISPSAMIDTLRDAVAARFLISAEEMDRTELYQLTSPIEHESVDPSNANQRLKNINISSDSKEVKIIDNNAATVEEYFPNQLKPGIHIIFQTTHLGKRGRDLDSEEETTSKKRQTMDVVRSQVPSVAAYPATFNSLQMKASGPIIYCNRPPAATSTPVTLLDPVFGKFVDDCVNLKPTAEDHKIVHQLTHAMSDVYPNEHARAMRFRQILRDVYDIDLSAGNLDPTRYESDGHARIGKHVYLLTEVKAEVGVGGAEPYFQGGLYHHEYVKIQRKNSPDPGLRFPWFQVILCGAYMGIAGSAVTDRIHMDTLTPMLPLSCHQSDTPMRKMMARHLGALREGLNTLRAYYKDLVPQASTPKNAALYPYPTSFSSFSSHTREHFKYKRQLRSSTAGNEKLVFFGELQDSQGAMVDVCIKFTREYSENAHEYCAKEGWAPRLLGCEKLSGGWYMVVMEDMTEHKQLGSLSVEDREELKAGGLHDQLLAALKHLHAANMVHGDLRDANILVRRDVQTGRVDVKIIDFDWAGVAGTASYPANINYVDIRRPDDARDDLPIKAEHDLAMLGYLFPSSS